MRRFAFRLALKLGKANVDQMLREMTAEQLREWQIFGELEPFGEHREDLRSGMIVQTLANTNRDRKKQPKAFPIEQCVVPGGDAFETPEAVADETKPAPRAKPQQSWQEMKMIALMMAAGRTA